MRFIVIFSTILICKAIIQPLAVTPFQGVDLKFIFVVAVIAFILDIIDFFYELEED